MADTTATNDDCSDDLMADFLDESSQLIERLNERLMQLEDWVRESCEEDECVDMDLLNDMFRSAHSIKGLSAMLGLPRINGLTHNIENVFDAARRGELAINMDVVHVVYASVDRLSELIDHLRDTQTDDLDCEEQLRAITAILEAEGALKVQGEQNSIDQAFGEMANGDDASNPIESTEANTEQNANAAAAVSAECEALFQGVVDEAEVPTKYLAIFLDETELSLDEMVDILLDSDVSKDVEAVRTLMCTAHRIKGSAASIGLNRPAKLAHVMEDVLQRHRDSAQSLSTFLIDALLGCADGLRVYLKELREGVVAEVQFPFLATELLVAEASQAPAPSSETIENEAEPVEEEPRQELNHESLRELAKTNCRLENARLCVVRVELVRDALLVGLKAQLLCEKLARIGQVLMTEPLRRELESCTALSYVEIGMLTSHSDSEIFRAINVSGVIGYSIDVLGKIDVAEGIATTPPKAESEPEKVAEAVPTVAEPQEAEETKLQEVLAEATNLCSAAASATVTAPPAPAAPPAPVAPVAVAAQKPAAPAKAPQPAKTAAKPSATATSTSEPSNRSTEAAKPVETLRVDIDRLDQLMNLAGQLVISKARFNQLGENLRAAIPHKQCQHWMESTEQMCGKLLQSTDDSPGGLSDKEISSIQIQMRKIQQNLKAIGTELQRVESVRTGMANFFEAVHQLDRVTDGIQKTIMDTRMVPIGPLFGRFRRVVRDISRNSGKEISLEIMGEKTELDKRMIDELGDPLIHMVRNSADHGVESPEERVKAGKPRSGQINLNAFHRGNSIVIQVTDDGRGLSREKILAKAIERGLVIQPDAERMTDQQVYQLIWEPGFSTAEAITEISGRGMGMDIVRSKIESINGVVEVDSTPGEGSVFTIKLPLTMAILPSLMSRIAGDLFSIPVESIVEIVCLRQDEIRTIHGKKTALVRGRPVSVVELDETFQWHHHRERKQTSSDVTIVIFRNDSRELGLVVDGILGEEDVVVKSLAENYQNVEGIAGACVLGNGCVALILDPAAVIDLAIKRQAAV